MSTSSTPYTVRYLAPVQQTPDESTFLTNSMSRHLTDHESTLLTDFLSRHLTDRSKWPLDQEQSKHYWASFIYSHGRAGNLFPFVVTHEDPTASASATSDGEGDTGGKVVGVGMYLRKGRLDEADESDPTNWLVTARDSLWNELPSGTSSDGEPIFGRFEPDCDEYEPTIEALDEIPRICTIVVDPAHRLPDRPVERELVKSMLAHLAHNNNHEPSIAAGYNADKELYESEGFKHIWRRELVHPEITNADGTAKPFQELYFVEEVI